MLFLFNVYMIFLFDEFFDVVIFLIKCVLNYKWNESCLVFIVGFVFSWLVFN